MTNPADFSAAEIFDLAVQTEHNGKAFYEAAAAAAQDPEVRRLLGYLAQAEQEHEQTFRTLRGASSADLAESYGGEREEYMNALLQLRVLPDEKTGLQRVRQMREDVEALDFAIAFEKDTILFMHEMREVLPQEERDGINVLIQQEQTHVRLLMELRSKRLRTAD